MLPQDNFLLKQAQKLLNTPTSPTVLEAKNALDGLCEVIAPGWMSPLSSKVAKCCVGLAATCRMRCRFICLVLLFYSRIVCRQAMAEFHMGRR